MGSGRYRHRVCTESDLYNLLYVTYNVWGRPAILGCCGWALRKRWCSVLLSWYKNDFSGNSFQLESPGIYLENRIMRNFASFENRVYEEKSNGFLPSGAASVQAGLKWPLHHPKLAGAPRRAAKVWEKLYCYLECGKESRGFMYNFLFSESNIVINKLRETTGRRIQHECLPFLRLWELWGIQIASFTLGFDSEITWSKLSVVSWLKGTWEVTLCYRDKDVHSGKNRFGIGEL